MNKEELITNLLDYFYHEDKSLMQFEIPEDEEEKRKHLDNIIALREPNEIDEYTLAMESKLLQIEKEEREVMDAKEIKTIKETLSSDDEMADIFALWQGDITTLKVDAIVNPANASLLGCSIPYHKCVDRLVHSRAGIGLKLECNDIIKRQMHHENNGTAKITNAYNLPCKYILHTVGPMVDGNLTEENKIDLENSYIAVLELAKKKEIRTLAIPCISTGEYHFPKNIAAPIAVETIKEYLLTNPNTFDKIIINVYTNEDYNEYRKLF